MTSKVIEYHIGSGAVSEFWSGECEMASEASRKFYASHPPDDQLNRRVPAAPLKPPLIMIIKLNQACCTVSLVNLSTFNIQYLWRVFYLPLEHIISHLIIPLYRFYPPPFLQSPKPLTELYPTYPFFISFIRNRKHTTPKNLEENSMRIFKNKQ